MRSRQLSHETPCLFCLGLVRHRGRPVLRMWAQLRHRDDDVYGHWRMANDSRRPGAPHRPPRAHARACGRSGGRRTGESSRRVRRSIFILLGKKYTSAGHVVSAWRPNLIERASGWAGGGGIHAHACPHVGDGVARLPRRGFARDSLHSMAISMQVDRNL